MNDKEFEDALGVLEQAIWPCTAEKIRARDTAQREALARVEAELADEAANHVTTSRDRDRWRSHSYSVAEQRDTAQAQLAEAVGLLKYAMESSSFREILTLERDIAGFLARHAQAEQQEVQGAQAGDERVTFDKWRNAQADSLRRCGFPDGAQAFLNLGSVQWAGWQARAALATQPAVQDKSFPKTISGFFEGESACLDCGKKFNLYYNGGELDSHKCCGLEYKLEHSGEVDLVIYDVRGAEHE